ncbi:MAG: hypothetical protein JWQ39_2242 [Glaciihabitans sp.]|nr:hypothetical protein [Glaciihabitans sp.]
MSSNLAYSLPARRPIDDFVEEQHPRTIRAVSTRANRRTRPRMVYALVAISVIFAIFLAQLLLTISLSSGAYNIGRLQSQQRDLTRTASALDEQLNTLGSTQNLSADASSLGMVASSSFAFLRISDGKVIGTAVAAGRPGSRQKISAAGGSVPNSLLGGVPVIRPTASGHGASNTANSSSSGSQSNSNGGSTGSSSQGTSGGGTGSTNSGDLPSPQTH